MIKIVRKVSVLCAVVFFTSTHLHALKQPTMQTLAPKDYIFIENNVDKEYFIAPDALDPRFTGSNVWNKHKSNQTSIGYMGTNHALAVNGYVDYWTEGTSINQPYVGSRCLMLAGTTRCPASGYLPAAKIDNRGAYKIAVSAGEDGGSYARAAFGPNAYEHFRKMPIGSQEHIVLNACGTREEYSPANGTYCKDAKVGNWYSYLFTLNKYAHIKLLDTKAFQEVWYGTDGTPYLTPNSTYCQYGSVPTGGTADQKTGIMCKMLKYNIEGSPTTFSLYYYLYMVTDNASFGFTPNTYDLRIHGGTGDWKRYDQANALNRMKDMMTSGDNYISVFFSNSFFQKLAKAKVNIRNIDNLFTFAVDNSVAPQSGFYQFSVSTKVELIPREYSVSIQPKGLPEGSTPVKTGKIGDPNPITFEYMVKQSAPRQADTIEAYVSAPSVRKENESYCLFTSDDNKTKVPIPAWLSMQNIANQEVKTYSGCDITKKLNMKNAMWQAEPWDSFGSGYFYTTDLKLIFPMSDPVSGVSMEGLDWMGKVRAEGEIKVVAKWIGVNFP
ncbi:hypothetical protein [Acinetobacter rudis]|uniref:Fimbrial protein n=1 Tax=Acinetobacter rudis CIP 110305 TaxID=421052 RepID=S3MQ93_9GAMM|nr:hypothetical protein [Acinetobacter rudis]EPF70090.1 hypothetical protein F945_03107 [Acinetobacter rudis CIP 110305]